MAITTTSDVTYDQAAYDMLTRFALRPALVFDRFATVRPTRQSMPGSSVIFNLTNDIATATTPLTENTDVTPVTMGDSQVTVTLNEYGNAVGTTRKLKGTSYIPVDPVLANEIGYNAAATMDDLALAPLKAGTNVVYAGSATSRVTVAAASTITSAKIRYVVAKIRGANGLTWDGDSYAGIIHPDVSYDLRSETGAAAWRDPHLYTEGGNQNLWNAEIGKYEGVRWMEVSKAPMIADAGVGGTVDVYLTLIFGQQSLAKVWSATESGPEPEVRMSPMTDKLWRFIHMGWYWLGGYGRYREASLYRIESSSSIGVNT